jgi:hypothetical protein
VAWLLKVRLTRLSFFCYLRRRQAVRLVAGGHDDLHEPGNVRSQPAEDGEPQAETDPYCSNHSHGNSEILPVAVCVWAREEDDGELTHPDWPVPRTVKHCPGRVCWPRPSGRYGRNTILGGLHALFSTWYPTKEKAPRHLDWCVQTPARPTLSFSPPLLPNTVFLSRSYSAMRPSHQTYL